MPCYHPLRGWRSNDGEVTIGKEVPDSTYLRIPCNNCLGCRKAHAEAWAMRCHFEEQRHKHTAWSTLTFSDENLPDKEWFPGGNLDVRRLQLFTKRLRKALGTAGALRFFASGEYGDRTNRPHYHIILFGLHAETHRRLIETSWGLGNTYTIPITPALIGYTAGYTAKKIGFKPDPRNAETDPETGAVYQWQPPFLQMSRRPGIGGHLRNPPGMGPHRPQDIQAATKSWRSYIISNGFKKAVPRFLHEAWKAQATQEQIEELHQERLELALNRDTSETILNNGELIALEKLKMKGHGRKL